MVAIVFDSAVLAGLIEAVPRAAGRPTVTAAAVLLGSTAVLNVGLAVALFPLLIQLLRGLSRAARWLRRWAACCLLGVVLFASASIVLSIGTASPGTSGPGLWFYSSVVRAVGSVYPAAVLLLMRSPRRL